jgi:hypothetical protein
MRPPVSSTAAAALMLALSCSGPGPTEEPSGPGPQDAGAPPARSARTLPVPGGASPSSSKEAPRGLRWDVPAGWIEERPSSSMRLTQYRVSGRGGDAELAVFYFGPGQGGDPMSNAARWAQQFTQPGGGSSLESMQTTRLEKTALPVHLVEVTGTYSGGMTGSDKPAQELPNYMLLGAIAEGPDAPWFFKLTGPEATVRAQREAFVRMLESIRAGG